MFANALFFMLWLHWKTLMWYTFQAKTKPIRLIVCLLFCLWAWAGWNVQTTNESNIKKCKYGIVWAVTLIQIETKPNQIFWGASNSIKDPPIKNMLLVFMQFWSFDKHSEVSNWKKISNPIILWCSSILFILIFTNKTHHLPKKATWSQWNENKIKSKYENRKYKAFQFWVCTQHIKSSNQKIRW